MVAQFAADIKPFYRLIAAVGLKKIRWFLIDFGKQMNLLFLILEPHWLKLNRSENIHGPNVFLPCMHAFE